MLINTCTTYDNIKHFGEILEEDMAELGLVEITPNKVPNKEPPWEKPKIYLHDLSRITTPCTFKLVGYIKHRR